MKRSLFIDTSMMGSRKKHKGKQQKHWKYPRFPVNIVVFVPFDSIKCNFGTRHKPCSIIEEENFTRTLSGLLSKKRNSQEEKEKKWQEKKRKRCKEKKGNLSESSSTLAGDWQAVGWNRPEGNKITGQKEALTNQWRGGSRLHSGDVSTLAEKPLKAAVAFSHEPLIT